MLEVSAARLAAPKMTDEVVEELQKLADQAAGSAETTEPLLRA